MASLVEGLVVCSLSALQCVLWQKLGQFEVGVFRVQLIPMALVEKLYCISCLTVPVTISSRLVAVKLTKLHCSSCMEASAAQ